MILGEPRFVLEFPNWTPTLTIVKSRSARVGVFLVRTNTANNEDLTAVARILCRRNAAIAFRLNDSDNFPRSPTRPQQSNAIYQDYKNEQRPQRIARQPAAFLGRGIRSRIGRSVRHDVFILHPARAAVKIARGAVRVFPRFCNARTSQSLMEISPDSPRMPLSPAINIPMTPLHAPQCTGAGDLPGRPDAERFYRARRTTCLHARRI